MRYFSDVNMPNAPLRHAEQGPDIQILLTQC